MTKAQLEKENLALRSDLAKALKNAGDIESLQYKIDSSKKDVAKLKVKLNNIKLLSDTYVELEGEFEEKEDKRKTGW